MVLLDRVVSFEDENLVTEVTIREDTLFCEAGGVPGWIGVEYMAQAVAAHAGAHARLAGNPPAIGFLLGTRSYECSVSQFSLGETLTVLCRATLQRVWARCFLMSHRDRSSYCLRND